MPQKAEPILAKLRELYVPVDSRREAAAEDLADA
jgi:hypothetical protein